ncbi:MAG: hypothetical protein GC160_20365 [Acidobacteria bacterium]|nr:hypothetical protein [Acidobacteriota bacterium]
MSVETVKSLLWPLSDFWTDQTAAREVETIDAEQIPQPYRDLLCHARDMTPTLETFWQDKLHLDVLARLEARGELFRHVILRTEDGRAAAFGAIRIRVTAFPEDARPRILEGRAPLGTILREHDVPHRSAPTGFFRTEPNALTRQAFGPTAAKVHYGRHNELSGPTGLLAEVVEILPSLD